MTITDIMNNSEGSLGARMTIYRKLQKLIKIGYIKMGCLINHADTFYLSEKGIQTVEGGRSQTFCKNRHQTDKMGSIEKKDPLRFLKSS